MERINKYIRETGGMPGGIEEEVLTKFYKEHSRLPGEYPESFYRDFKIAFWLFGIGMFIGIIGLALELLK